MRKNEGQGGSARGRKGEQHRSLRQTELRQLTTTKTETTANETTMMMVDTMMMSRSSTPDAIIAEGGKEGVGREPGREEEQVELEMDVGGGGWGEDGLRGEELKAESGRGDEEFERERGVERRKDVAEMKGEKGPRAVWEMGRWRSTRLVLFRF